MGEKSFFKDNTAFPEPVDTNREKDKARTLWSKWILLKGAVKKQNYLRVSLDCC